MLKLQRVLYAAVAAGLSMPVAQAAVEEITVSAQRRDANLQEVPIAVTAISAEDIEKLQINFVADIAKNVPNLQTYTITAGGAAMQVFMRGAGVQNPGFNASEAPVGIYIDDVYRGRLASANLDVADIERIEVLRGPQGTLYGRNSIAGAIKVYTRTPAEDFYVDTSVGIGNYDTYKLKGAVGGQVAEGLGMSISGLYNRRDEGWIERGSTGGRDLGEFENKAVRGKLNWFGGDVFSAVITGDYSEVENDGYNGIPYDGVPGEPLEGFYDSLVPDNSIGFGVTKQANASIDLSWAVGGVTLRSITSYADIRDTFGFDLNGGAVAVGPGYITGVRGVYIQSQSDNSTFSQEFTVSGDGEIFDWITGLYYMKERGDQDYAAGNAVIPIDLLEQSKSNTTSYALFGEGTWTITEKFSLTAGIRWTLDDKDYTVNCSGASCGLAGDWTNDLGDNWNEFTPRLLLQYQFDDNTMIYGGVSRGYQAGGFQTLCFGNQECNSIVYDPQTVVSWEAGVKTELMENRLRVNTSVFYAQYSSLQQTAIGPLGDFGQPSFPVQNVGSADVAGLEVEATWALNENWDLWAIVGLADEDISSDNLDSSVDRLPGLPRKTIRLGADYRINAPGLDNWDLVAGADLNYASDYYATINNVLEISSYTRFNGRIGLEQQDGPWSAFLSGTNLTDEEDLYSGIAGGGTNIRTPQPPREYMLTVNYRL